MSKIFDRWNKIIEKEDNSSFVTFADIMPKIGEQENIDRDDISICNKCISKEICEIYMYHMEIEENVYCPVLNCKYFNEESQDAHDIS